jgi:hypothetical protein
VDEAATRTGERERPADDPIPRWTRAFAYGLIALVLVAGVASIEAWPLSGFKLFSATRSSTRVSWELQAVVDGEEQRLAIGETGAELGYSTLILADFDEMAADERDDVCAAWVAPLRDAGTAVDELRIYRVTADIRPDGPDPVIRRMWTCTRS